MKQTVKVLMERDGMTREEAEEMVRNAKDEIYNMLEEAEYDEIEDMLAYDFGLEMDYIFDFI
jgi:hypothetical protein